MSTSETPPAEYIIILHEQISGKYSEYLIQRIAETGLKVQLVSYDKTLNFLKISAPKEWLIHYFSNEEHMEQYCSFDMNTKQQQQRIEEIKRLPKSALLPSALLSHIIDATLQNINIDSQFIDLLNSDPQQTDSRLMPLDKLLSVCKKYGLIDDIFPMSTKQDLTINLMKNKRKKWKLFFDLTAFFNSNNLHKIRDYYGETIAFYFAFMEHYVSYLMIPGVCGLLFYGSRSSSFDIDESKYMPFFALFVCIWSHFMIKCWNRKASHLALEWNTIQFAKEKYLIQEIRPEFRGVIRKSPITEKDELYYAAYKRYPKFCVGLLITLLMLSLVFLMMVCSLNLQGYIRSKQSVIYIDYFAALSKPNALFDKDSSIMWIVPTLIHCIFVFFLNTQYSTVALKLTNWENWKFESEFENSLILKRFLFEFLDSFLPLFYICFYEMDMDVLTGELLSLFLCDEIRRICTESVIPLALHLWQRKEVKKEDAVDEDEGYNVLLESRLEKYELFDDYLEMITQFGYITLFASCYPLAAILSLISNVFEVWSDSFKLVFLSQRPVVERAYNMHSTWISILQFMAWFSILTNCYIFAFSSEQMEEWFPQYFNPDDVQHTDEIKTGHGRYVVLIMFALEHVIGLVCLLIHYMIPNITKNVDIQLQKKQHALHIEYIENMNKVKRNIFDEKSTNIKERED